MVKVKRGISIICFVVIFSALSITIYGGKNVANIEEITSRSEVENLLKPRNITTDWLKSYEFGQRISNEKRSRELSEKIKGRKIYVEIMEEILVRNPNDITCNDLELELIYDSWSVDYRSYIPEKIKCKTAEEALDIDSPDISIAAEAAIVMDAETGEVLFQKNGLEPIFPASTSKLLTALVAQEWSDSDEIVQLGDEIRMIASDSSKAHLRVGQTLTMGTLLDALLLPSGNDAAYGVAAYIGRKSLNDEDAIPEEEILEFVRLMNEKAKQLGATNSCFKTPDGYDALGQYVTAYDMAIIGAEALKNNIILSSCKKTEAQHYLTSGESYMWRNTNALIYTEGFWHNPGIIGSKTGTSTMAGRCLISVGQKSGRKLVIVVMNSSSEGRWRDTTRLLDNTLK